MNTVSRSDYANQNYYSASLRYSESFEEPQPLPYAPRDVGPTRTELREYGSSVVLVEVPDHSRSSCPRWDLMM